MIDAGTEIVIKEHKWLLKYSNELMKNMVYSSRVTKGKMDY